MRIHAIAILAGVLCGCAAPPLEAPANRTPAAPALVEIPAAPEQPVSKLEKAVKPLTGDVDAIAGRGYIRILVAPSRTHFETIDGNHRGRAVDAGVALAVDAGARLIRVHDPAAMADVVRVAEAVVGGRA